MPSSPASIVTLGCTPEAARRVEPLAVRAYDEARSRSWPFLSDVLERTMRGVPEDDRGAVAALTHALVKYDRLLGFVSGAASSESRCAALLELVEGETDPSPRLARISDATERLATTYSVPDWLVGVLQRELGVERAPLALARINEAPPRVLRVNTLKTSRDACVAALAEEGVTVRPVRFARQGVVVDGVRSVFRTKAFARGELEVQDEASQLVAEVVAPPPRSFVVDACAGAGGKTLALAALLENKGKVLALDPSEGKLEELRRRGRRAGVSNVEARAVDLLAPGDALASLEGRAARVLVDAPCTGTGALRRNPEARWRLKEPDLPRLGEQQLALCAAAAPLVLPGGRLVYATCSFLPSEGEGVFERFLSEHPAFRVVTVRDVAGRARTDGVATPDGKYLRTWRWDGTPDGGDDGMDGFFVGVARRISP